MALISDLPKVALAKGLAKTSSTKMKIANALISALVLVARYALHHKLSIQLIVSALKGMKVAATSEVS